MQTHIGGDPEQWGLCYKHPCFKSNPREPQIEFRCISFICTLPHRNLTLHFDRKKANKLILPSINVLPQLGGNVDSCKSRRLFTFCYMMFHASGFGALALPVTPRAAEPACQGTYKARDKTRGYSVASNKTKQLQIVNGKCRARSIR